MQQKQCRTATGRGPDEHLPGAGRHETTAVLPLANAGGQHGCDAISTVAKVRRTPPPAGTSTPGCGRRMHRRCAAPAATPSAGIPCPAGRPPARGCTGGPTRRPAGTRRCAGRCAAGCPRRASPRPDLVDLAANRDHRLAERVHLGQALTLGRLHHQGARHREAHRRCVKTVVRQPLRHVVDGDSGGLGDTAQIQDALVGDHAVLAGVEHRVVLVEPAGDVVRRGDRRQRGIPQPASAHHPDVGPRDRQDRRRPVRSRGHHMPVRQLVGQRVAGQIRRQMRAHRDRADAGPAAAVRDAERLVQVQVADVAAELARSGQTDQRVEVGAVDVDLAAGVVHRRADVGDVVLVDAVGGRVGDHQRGQHVGVFGHLGPQVVEVDVASRSSRRQATTTTRIPAIAADAALVPCALDGIRHTSRWVSPRPA